MATRVYPKRYAQAVFEIALEQQQVDKWQSDLKQLSAIGENTVLLTLLASPKLSFADKTALLDERLTGLSPLARNLAYVLVAKNKINWISSIAAAFAELVDNYRGVQHAEVTTAVTLDDAEKARLASSLNAIIGRKVVLTTKVDAGVVGGIVARIDGKLLDGSVRSKLLALKKELVGGKSS